MGEGGREKSSKDYGTDRSSYDWYGGGIRGGELACGSIGVGAGWSAVSAYQCGWAARGNGIVSTIETPAGRVRAGAIAISQRL